MNSNEHGLSVIRRSSLGDEAAAAIRARIINGDLPQGTKMREEDFATALGISRACIREAFMILGTEGLVHRERNRHTEVITFTKHDIEDIMRLRSTIETLCARMCFERSTVPLEALRQQAARIKAVEENYDETHAEYVKADMVLHETIVSASGNARAHALWRGLRSQMEALVYAVCHNNPHLAGAAGVHGHDELVDAFEQSDRERAVAILKEHIECNIPFLLRNLQEE